MPGLPDVQGPLVSVTCNFWTSLMKAVITVDVVPVTVHLTVSPFLTAMVLSTCRASEVYPRLLLFALASGPFHFTIPTYARAEDRAPKVHS